MHSAAGISLEPSQESPAEHVETFLVRLMTIAPMGVLELDGLSTLLYFLVRRSAEPDRRMIADGTLHTRPSRDGFSPKNKTPVCRSQVERFGSL